MKKIALANLLLFSSVASTALAGNIDQGVKLFTISHQTSRTYLINENSKDFGQFWIVNDDNFYRVRIKDGRWTIIPPTHNPDYIIPYYPKYAINVDDVHILQTDITHFDARSLWSSDDSANEFVKIASTQCLNKHGDQILHPVLNWSGTNVLNVAAGMTVDLQFNLMMANVPALYPLKFADPPADVCLTRYNVAGQQPLLYPWRVVKSKYDGDGVLFKFATGPVTVENSVFYNVEDAISPRSLNHSSWTVRGVYANYIKDDFVENDQCLPGLIEDVLVDHSFVFLSSRPGRGASCAGGGSVTIRNAIVHLGHSPYDTDIGGRPAAMGSLVAGNGQGQLFKIGPSMGPVNVSDSIFLVEGISVNGWESMSWPAGDYHNVFFIWGGNGPYRGPALPSGVTLSTNRQLYENTRAAWLNLHGCDVVRNSCTFSRHLTEDR